MCIVVCFLAPGCCLLAAPGECEHGPASCSGSAPRGSCLLGRHPLGLSDPSHRHWHRSSSGTAGNRYVSPRQELRRAQPSSGQGKSRPVQTLGHFAWNEKALFMQQQRASTPETIFRYFFFPCVAFFSAVTCLHSLEVIKGLTKLDNVVCNRMRKYFIQFSIQYILLVYISISGKGENITGVSY